MQRSFDRTIGIAFIAFIALGLPDGIIGVAWPSIQAEFDLRPSAIGGFFLAATGGFILISLNSAGLVRRFGVGPVLTAAFLVRGLVLAAFLLAPSWETIVLLGFVEGLAGGAIDTGLNVYVTAYNNPRLMNWLHASFGVGTVIGPLVMTALFSAGASWRWGFVIVGLGSMLVAGVFLATLGDWVRKAANGNGDDDEAPSARLTETLRLPMAWFGALAFMVYVGLEITAGQWSYSLLTTGRGIDPALAGLVVSGYWATFTIGRVVFGLLSDRLNGDQQLGVGIVLSMIGTLLLTWNPTPALGMAGLLIVGFAFAPMFPMLMNGTTARVGVRHTPNAVGLQMVGTSAGVALLPWLAGLLVEVRTAPQPFLSELPLRTDLLTPSPALEVIGPFMVVVTVIFGGVWLLMKARGPAHRPARTTPASPEAATP